ncbi:MAG: sensor histidine kinase [Candidatus Hodarchaeota archaeon]
MALIEISILEFALSILTTIGLIIFIIAHLKRKDLLYWLCAYIFLTLGYITNHIRIFFIIFELISFVFFTLAVIFVFIAVFIEYFQIFLKKRFVKNHHSQKVLILVTVGDIVALGIVNFMLVLLIITLLMFIRIYFRKKTLTHAFLGLSIIAAMFSVVGNILINLSIEGSHEINISADIFLTTILMLTGIVAIIEEKITESERKYREAYDRETFYKDLVAHDINNILQNIQSSSELLSLSLKESKNLDNVAEMINLIEEQIKRGSNLVSNVRALSELEEAEIILEPIEIYEFLNKAIKYTTKRFQEKNIRIDIESDSDKTNVKANELLLDVFENILINAVKYNENPSIEIQIKHSKLKMEDKNYHKLEFTDNGIGIPDYMKEKIFTRVYRKDKSVSGMGLGLSLVKKIIEKYDGYIWVEDKIKGEPNKGSNFIILLPELLNN